MLGHHVVPFETSVLTSGILINAARLQSSISYSLVSPAPQRQLPVPGSFATPAVGLDGRGRRKLTGEVSTRVVPPVFPRNLPSAINALAQRVNAA
jgi:hypothetical protein